MVVICIVLLIDYQLLTNGKDRFRERKYQFYKTDELMEIFPN